MAAVFLSDPVSLTISGAGWNTIDLSANVPSGATGAIIHFLSAAGAGINVAVRHPDSTDELYLLIGAGRQQQDFSGVDASRNIELYASSNIGISAYLVGYFDDRAVFFTNAVSKGAITSSWADYDFTSDVGTDPIVGALCTSNSTYQLEHRMDGSSDALGGAGTIAFSFLANVDSSTKITEVKAGNTSAYVLYLKGYIKSGYVPSSTATTRSTTNTGAYEAITPTTGAVGYNYTAKTASSSDTFGIKAGTATYDPYKILPSGNAMQFLVGASPEQKVSAATTSLYERGYFTAASTTYPQSRGRLIGTGTIGQGNGFGYKRF